MVSGRPASSAAALGAILGLVIGVPCWFFAPELLRLMEMLEDQDDVQNVWANFELDEELLAEFA